jgi:hypothetical protein
MFVFFATGLLSLLAAAVPISSGLEPSSPTGERPANFESGQRAGGAELLRAIELHYPEEHRALSESLDRAAAAHPGDEAEKVRSRSKLLADFFRLRSKGLANAPDALLTSINERQLTLIKLLARDDAKLCAEFATTLFIGRFDLPAFYQERSNALSIAMIEASKAGEKLPPNPAREGLGGGDAALWYEQLLLVEPSSEIQAAIAMGGAETSGSPEMQCRVGAATYGAIEKLPPESAANVGAFFLAQVLREPGD